MNEESFLLNIDRSSLYFTRERSLHKAWRAEFEGGVVLLTCEESPTMGTQYKALFQTTSGAVLAEGCASGAYAKGVDEGGQEAVTAMWEEVQLEVDRFRLLMRLATR